MGVTMHYDETMLRDLCDATPLRYEVIFWELYEDVKRVGATDSIFEACRWIGPARVQRGHPRNHER
jgi:hypothetical protein